MNAVLINKKTIRMKHVRVAISKCPSVLQEAVALPAHRTPKRRYGGVKFTIELPSSDSHRVADASLGVGSRALQTHGGLLALGGAPLVAARRERPAEQHEAPDGAGDRVAAAAAKERARTRELGTHVRESNVKRNASSVRETRKQENNTNRKSSLSLSASQDENIIYAYSL